MLQDVRYAIRGFLKSPFFTLIAVLSIALGVGSNAAIFSLLDQVLLRPLPVENPDRLVMLDLPGPRAGSTFSDLSFSNAMYRVLRTQNQSFDALIAVYNDSANFSYRGRSETIPTALVSGNYFSGLGLNPAHGRLIASNDDIRKNGHPVVVLSYGYFMRRFGGDPAIIGSTVRINSQPYEIAGVAPKGFAGLELNAVASIYVPLSQKTQITTTWDGMDDPNFYFLHVYGSLKSGISPVAAKANLDALLPPLVEDEMRAFPSISQKGQQRWRAKRFTLTSAATPLVGNRDMIQRVLFLLLGVVGLVLLISCANVANLLLARAGARSKEVAVQMALGAGRFRLARQMLVESLLLALIGGAFGLILSIWILDGILAIQRNDTSIESFLQSQPDWRMALFTLAASLLTGLLFGIVPAFKRPGFGIFGTLKENAGSIIGFGSHGLLRRGLVVGQIALSLVLLVGAGLFARSLMNIRNSDPGFKVDHLLSFRIDTSLNGYQTDRAVSFLDRYRTDLAAIPGVKEVAIASAPLLENEVNQATMSIEGHPRRDGQNTNARINSVGPGFFRTMGFPLLAGREFLPSDQANSLKVAVVNEVFAKEYFNGNAIGKKIGYGFKKDGSLKLDFEIVGVIRDGKHGNMREEKPSRFVYTPYAQSDSIQAMTFYLRSDRDPEQLTSDVRTSLRRVDENLAMFRVQTMETTIERSLQLDRLLSLLCSSFGLLATVLASVGLYGVMAFNVTRRTREIGIRLALGAERTSVVGLIMKEVGWMLALGLLLGIPAAIGLGRLVESQLWGLKSWDPLVLTAASFCLFLVAALAGLMPAWRASRVAPMIALRYE
jgi:predicted permease